MSTPSAPLSVEEQVVWAQLKDSGIPDSVNSFYDYKAKAAYGLALAQLDVVDSDEKFPCSVEEVQQAHKTAFGKVDSNAGEFRTTVGIFGGYAGADPHRLKREMSMMEAQSDFLFGKAKTSTELLEATAFMHARMIRIHPFKDGNGRTSRLFLFAHLREGLNIPMDMIANEFDTHKPDYIKAMNDTAKENDLTPLMSFLADGIERAHPSLEKIPVSEKNPSPFRITADPNVPFGERTDFTDDLHASKNPDYFKKLPSKSITGVMKISGAPLPNSKSLEPIPSGYLSRNELDTPEVDPVDVE